MTDVFIIGAGQTPVTRGTPTRIRDMLAHATRAAVAAAGIEDSAIGAIYVGNMAAGMLSSQTQLGPLVAESAGLSGIEALTTEAACASGAAAMRMGYIAVKAGLHSAVIVCGVEQLTHADKTLATKALATAADFELESNRGETFLSLNAMLMREYLRRYRLQADQLSGFSITAHANAVNNASALFRKTITQDDFCSSRTIVDPLRLYDVSPLCDGAAAIVIANDDIVDHLRPARRVRVTASAVATASLALANRSEGLQLEAARRAFNTALAQAGISRDQIDLYELHDAYTIMTALSLEAAGFAAPGEGWRMAADGSTTLTGKLPISTFGGLKARGHPVGATGVYQLLEAYSQLTGSAGLNQVRDARFAMTQNIGGTASTAINHVLELCD